MKRMITLELAVAGDAAMMVTDNIRISAQRTAIFWLRALTPQELAEEIQ